MGVALPPTGRLSPWRVAPPGRERSFPAVAAKNKGNGYFKSGDLDNAIKHYSEAIQADASYHVPYSNRSQAYFKQGKYDLAAQDGQSCIRVNPKFVKGYHRATNALLMLEKYDVVMKVLDTAYRSGFRGNVDLAEIDAKARPKAEAMEKAGRAQMGRAERLKCEGNDLVKKGMYEEALHKYTAAVEACNLPEDKKVYVAAVGNRALCWQQQSSFSNMIADCNLVLEQDEQNVKALFRRSSAFEGMEKYRLALQDIRQVLLIMPNWEAANKAQHRLGRAVQQLKKAKARGL